MKSRRKKPAGDPSATEGGRISPGASDDRVLRIAAALAVGLIAAMITHWLPNAITLRGVPIGDVGPPLVGMQRLLAGLSPYDIALASGPVAQYPLTTMVVLAPFLLVPTALVAPLFSGLSASVLAFLVTAGGRWWRLQLFLSVPFVMALYSVQWSPLFAAALLCPSLLFLAVVKPQLGVVLVAAGRWNLRAAALTAVVVSVSFLVRPAWPLEWWRSGVLGQFDAQVPILLLPHGVLLVLGLFFVRRRVGRLVVAMAVVPQRFWYDQVLLFLVPATWRQMTLLVVTSWIGVWWCLSHGWDPADGTQFVGVWRVVVASVHLPALGLVAWQWRRGDPEPEGL